MKRFQRFQFAAAGVAALGLVLPTGVTMAADGNRPAARATSAAPIGQTAWGQATAATAPARRGPAVLDVALGNGGVLAGQVVDAQGRPIAQIPVVVRAANGQMAVVGTDGGGRFQMRGLPGGLYDVTAAGRTSNCRLWAGNASPPGAVPQVMMVGDGQVMRGQTWPSAQGPPMGSGARQGGKYFGGAGAFLGGVIILGSLGGIVAGGIITGEQGPAS